MNHISYIHCIVKGRVQMVMFRDFTRRAATRLGLTGFVRNRSDGTVEVCAEGSPDALRELLARLHKGSIASRVDDVVCEWGEEEQRYEEFLIRYD